ncbi:ATP-binding protein [Gelidibacter algens]|nr:ATP-binding protein [Gelidibacter algens]
MKRIMLFLFILPLAVAGQSEQSAFLDTDLENQWVVLVNNWSYHLGDNKEWSNPSFNDSLWPKFSNMIINVPDSVAKENKNGIVWFRKKIKTVLPLNQQLVLRIYQTGASEIYLDGQLIHQLGRVSAAQDSIIYYNPGRDLLSFPLVPQKDQILAIRYANDPSQFPVFASGTGMILRVATLSHANADPPMLQYKIRYYIVFGVAIFMLILFLAYFLFFPTEKINLYFAISSLFFSLFIIAVLVLLNMHQKPFLAEFCIGFFLTCQALLILFCIYKILKQKFGLLFWSVVVLAAFLIGLLFLFDYLLITQIIGTIVLLEILRISIKSLKTDRRAALIFLVFCVINIAFWVAIILDQLSIMEVPSLWLYQPFAFLLMPLSLAIYLGYIFGNRSKSLQNKLKEVEQLSEENHRILSTQNETLEMQVNERTSALNTSLENLKATQSQLIQAEKMASLGELTAGIAHEIQNPLNFVNNFSEVSKELLEEMQKELVAGNLEDVREIAKDVIQNLEKINHHGKRADGIVKGMLQHSRKNTGEKELTDINALVDEYLRLAYHGLRAKDKSFNATLETDYDHAIGKIEIVPQDIGRVMLNLITNAFYTITERKKGPLAPKGGTHEYEPTVSISTKLISPLRGDQGGILISVKDNGNGIPESALDKIFQPFFTTKPTGQGTGLGLSLSYDIINAHGGDLRVYTEENKGTEFVISLPIPK